MGFNPAHINCQVHCRPVLVCSELLNGCKSYHLTSQCHKISMLSSCIVNFGQVLGCFDLVGHDFSRKLCLYAIFVKG